MMRGDERSKLTIEQLKLITKCGQWHEDCTTPERPNIESVSHTSFSFVDAAGPTTVTVKHACEFLAKTV